MDRDDDTNDQDLEEESVTNYSWELEGGEKPPFNTEEYLKVLAQRRDHESISRKHNCVSQINASVAEPIRNFRGAEFPNGDYSTIGDERFEITDLYKAKLRGSFVGMSFLLSTLAEADLFNVNLFNANFHCANLYRCNLKWANVSSVNFRMATLVEANLVGARGINSDFTFAHMCHAKMSFGQFPKAVFDGAHLQWAYLGNSILSNAFMAGAQLQYANLTHADLSGCDFSGANLECARIENATISTATDFSGAIMPNGERFTTEGLSGPEEIIERYRYIDPDEDL